MNSEEIEKIKIHATPTIEINSSNGKTSNDYSIISSEDLMEIDGSILEGGGQILRISLALAVLLRKNLKITNIRAGRSNPGLQRQHLASANALAEISGSKIENLKLSSKEIILKLCDYTNIKQNYKCDCSGAGSIGLMIQQLIPVLLFSAYRSYFEIVGGTVVSHAPSTYYVNDVLKLILKRFMNIDLTVEVKRNGTYPRGGGIVNFSANPTKSIDPINLTSRGDLRSVMIRLVSSENFNKISVDSIFKNIFKESKKILNKIVNKKRMENLNVDFSEIDEEILIEKEYVQLSYSKNEKSFTLFCQIILKFQNTIVSVEELYSEKLEKQELNNFDDNIITKLEKLLSNDHECLDEFTVDHLIIFMALAKGRSKIHIGNISTHTLTAIEVIKNFIPSLEVIIICEENKNIIEIEGISWKNENIK